jgi:hypothetical protein
MDGNNMRMASWWWELILAGVLVCATAPRVLAGRARPWVCRDKAAFSSKRPMTYEAKATGRHTWILSFMQFQMGGPNEGFTSIEKNLLRPRGDSVTGQLPAGHYFAVAVYRRGSYWPCPQYVQEDDRVKPGVIATLCFGEESGSCPVKVTIRPADTAQSPHAQP